MPGRSLPARGRAIVAAIIVRVDPSYCSTRSSRPRAAKATRSTGSRESAIGAIADSAVGHKPTSASRINDGRSGK